MGSTKVNITVSDETGLVERNKAQTQENRTRTLEKNGDKLTYRISKEMQGKQEAKAPPPRLEQRRVGGRGLDPYRRDEPAAQRTATSDLAFHWGYSDNSYGTVELAGTRRVADGSGITTLTASNPSLVRTVPATYSTTFFSGAGTAQDTAPQYVDPITASYPPATEFGYTIRYYYQDIYRDALGNDVVNPRVYVDYGTLNPPSGAGGIVTIYGARFGTLTGALIRDRNASNGSYDIVLPVGARKWMCIRFVRQIGIDVDMTMYCQDYEVPLGTGFVDTAYANLTATLQARSTTIVTGFSVPDTPRPSFNVRQQLAQCATYVWVGDDRSLKRVTTPAYVASLNPAIESVPFAYGALQISDGLTRPVWGSPPFMQIPGITGGSYIKDPNIYSYLNNVLQFTSPSNIKQFDTGSVSSGATAFSKIYARDTQKQGGVFALGGSETAWFNNSQSKFYYKLKKKGSATAASVERRLQLSPNRPTLVDNPPLKGAYFKDCHDGGDPAYCRQMLLAMGFTAADLTP